MTPDYLWLQQICNNADLYSSITCEIKSLAMPNGQQFTLATNSYILVALQITSAEPGFPSTPSRESAVKMLTRREGQEVKFSDLYKWAEANKWHDCPYCGGTGDRSVIRFNLEDGLLEEMSGGLLLGILFGQPINRSLLHLPLNHLEAETVTIAELSDCKREDYAPIQIHCPEWILCVMPFEASNDQKATAPIFPG